MLNDFDPGLLVWVQDDDSLTALHQAIEQCEEVVFDLETTGLDENAMGEPHKNGGVPARIVMAQFTLPMPGDKSIEPTTWVVPLSHPDSPWRGQWRAVMRGLALEINRYEKPLVGHNIKFDCRWVHAQAGVDISKRIAWDTRISSHLLDENFSTKLKVRVAALFDIDRWDDFDLSYPGAAEEVPLFDLGLYGARDTYWTWRLAQAHRTVMFLLGDEYPSSPDEVEMARLGRLAVWCSMPTTATLTGIEQEGMILDRNWVFSQLSEHEEKSAQLHDKLRNMYDLGPDFPPENASFAPTSHWFRAWSQKAVDQNDLVIAELTPSGKPRWSKSVLTRQKRNGSLVASDLLDLRGHLKKAEFLRAWMDYRTAVDVIHTSYNAGSVVTGRLSSSGPNMQQVTSVLKPAFIPRVGFVFAELDYSQIELRVAAHISECQPMIEAFQRGEDLHTKLAAKITGKNPEDVTPAERQAGKSANFGLLYMMGAFGFREYAEDVYGVSLTMEEATAVHRAFFDTWEGMSAWHEKQKSRAHRSGKVVSPIGRIRRLPDIWSEDGGMVGFCERSAVNSPVQGFASDLMQLAAAQIAGTLPGSSPVQGARLVATVHDSILVEVPESNWKEVVEECVNRMLDLDDVLNRLECKMRVPLSVDAKVGTRWGLSDVGSL